jgi:hypothetical protein
MREAGVARSQPPHGYRVAAASRLRDRRVAKAGCVPANITTAVVVMFEKLLEFLSV